MPPHLVRSSLPPRLSIHLPALIGPSVYSAEVKTVTGAKGHRCAPHPIELTRPGRLSLQLPPAQTGVSNRRAERKLISAQHTVRGGAGMTAVHHWKEMGREGVRSRDTEERDTTQHTFGCKEKLETWTQKLQENVKETDTSVSESSGPP